MSRKDLARSLTLTTATAIVVGSIIGSGIFKKTAAMSDALPSPVLVLALWVVAGGISFLGALSAAELTATFPESGGLYAHLRRILGRFVGFLYGWSTLAVIQTGSIASVSYVFAEYLRFFVPWGDVPPAWAAWGVTLFGTIDLHPLRDLFTKLVAVACIATVTAMNVRGVRLGGAVQNVFMGIKFLIMAGIIGVAAFGASRLVENLSLPVLPSEMAPPSLGGSGSWMALAGAVTIALSGAFWAYDAWINVTYVAAEVKAPTRNVPRALALGLGAVLVCYLAVNVAYFHLLDLDAVRGSTLVAADALGRVLPAAAGLVAFAVVLSTFGAANGMALSSARVPFAMARDGLLPSALGRVDPRRETPANALWVQGAWSVVLVFSGTFDQVTDMLIFVSWAFYGLLALAVIVARVRFPDLPRPYRVPGYPWVPGVFITFSGVYVVLSVVENTRNALLGTALVLGGLPVWAWGRWRDSRATRPRP